MSQRVIERGRAAAALGLAAILLLPLHAQPQQQEEKFHPVEQGIPDQYIVVLDDRAAGPRGPSSRAPDVARELTTLYGGRVRFAYTHALSGFLAEMPEGVAQAISVDPRVVSVRQDVPVELFDTQFNPPWGLDRIDQRNRPLDSAYSYANSGAAVTVYVIDTGIRTSHVEFGGRASVGADFIGDGQNGQDCHGHGTHVAGTVGGSTYGVAKSVGLVSVRVFNCAGGGGTSGVIIAAVDWVTANRTLPAVANMSLGGPPDPNIDAAVRNSIATGVTYVVAAGNTNIDAGNVSPARVLEAVTVGGTDINDVRATWDAGGRSNYGSVLDVFAPGKGILSADYTSDTASLFREGTSMATPHVAGIAARYLQTNPGAAPSTVASVINGNATAGVVSDPGPGSPDLLVYSAFLDPPPSWQISFRAANGQWMVAEGNGGGSVNANRDAVGPWETFAVEDLNGGDLQDGDPVAFRTGGGWYLQAPAGGGDRFLATGTTVGSEETFTIVVLNDPGSRVEDGDSVALRSVNGYYVVAEGGGGGQVNCNRTAIGAWETWGIWLR
jgi:subtilisin family serine protease